MLAVFRSKQHLQNHFHRCKMKKIIFLTLIFTFKETTKHEIWVKKKLSEAVEKGKANAASAVSLLQSWKKLVHLIL